MARITVELSLREMIPLQAKVVGIVGFWNEARNTMADGVVVTADGSHQPAFIKISAPDEDCSIASG